MKDNRLEKEFEEYFKGVNTLSDITADAKKSVKPKRAIMPRIVKFASIAASFVLVFAVAIAVILKTDFNKAGDKEPSDGNGQYGGAPDGEGNAPSDSDPSSGAVQFELYTDGELEQRDSSAYSLSSLDSSLKLIENFALAKNANVVTCKTGYRDGKLALVTAEVNILNGLTRDETTIFVEFTDTNSIYSELADYYKGTVYYYGYYGYEYYLTETIGENGEPEFKLHILYRGVKYYFKVQSPDEKAYEKYLKMVIEKKY